MSFHGHYNQDRETRIAANGLRYISKKNGSLFAESGAFGYSRSCHLCGQHKPLGQVRFMKRYADYVCFGCKPAQLEEVALPPMRRAA